MTPTEPDTVAPLETLEDARSALREVILATVTYLTTDQFEDGVKRATALENLSAAYVRLGGNLELADQARALEAEQRVAELEDVLKAIDAAFYGLGAARLSPLLEDGAYRPLGIAVTRAAEVLNR